jgi:hypothetical protein
MFVPNVKHMYIKMQTQTQPIRLKESRMNTKSIILLFIILLISVNLYAAAPNTDDLIAAISDSNITKVRELIAAKVDPNATDRR